MTATILSHTDDEGVWLGIEGFSDGSALATVRLGADRLDVGLDAAALTDLHAAIGRHLGLTEQFAPPQSGRVAESARPVGPLVRRLPLTGRALQILGRRS